MKLDRIFSRLIALLLIVLLITAIGCGSVSTASWQTQYDLGMRYLSEGNYKEAMLAFEAAIEIDPRQSDPYIGLAKAHIATGDLDAARSVIEAATELLGEQESFTEMLSRIETQFAAQNSAEELEIIPEEDTPPEPENNPSVMTQDSVYETLGQAQYTQLATLTSTIYDAQGCSGWFNHGFDSSNPEHRLLFVYIYLSAGEDVMPNRPNVSHDSDGRTHDTYYLGERDMEAINQFFFASSFPAQGQTTWEISVSSYTKVSAYYADGTYCLRAPAGNPAYPLNLTAVTGMTDNGDGTYLVTLEKYSIDNHDVLRNCDPFTYYAMAPSEIAQCSDLSYLGEASAIVFLHNGQFYLQSMDYKK